MADAIGTTPTQEAAPAVTPGYKTTEFWFNIAALTLTALYASGVINAGSTLEKVLAISGSVLASLGYTASRSFVKANQ